MSFAVEPLVYTPNMSITPARSITSKQGCVGHGKHELPMDRRWAGVGDAAQRRTIGGSRLARDRKPTDDVNSTNPVLLTCAEFGTYPIYTHVRCLRRQPVFVFSLGEFLIIGPLQDNDVMIVGLSICYLAG